MEWSLHVTTRAQVLDDPRSSRRQLIGRDVLRLRRIAKSHPRPLPLQYSACKQGGKRADITDETLLAVEPPYGLLLWTVGGHFRPPVLGGRMWGIGVRAPWEQLWGGQVWGSAERERRMVTHCVTSRLFGGGGPHVWHGQDRRGTRNHPPSICSTSKRPSSRSSYRAAWT
jgi:hypothetical protein